MLILTNTLVAIILLVLLILIFIFLFRRIIPLNKIQLKKLDYFWLTLSAFGLFGLVERNRIQVTQIELTKSQWLLDGRYNDLKYIVDPATICFQYTKMASSPPDFDIRQKMTDSLCSWTKKMVPIISNIKKEEDSIHVIIPQFKDAYLTHHTDRFEKAINEYNRSLNMFLKLNKEKKESDFITIIQFLSPLLLVIGLALRFSKTAVEISLDKKNSNNG
jgi:Ca2+/Na+ antiporter